MPTYTLIDTPPQIIPAEKLSIGPFMRQHVEELHHSHGLVIVEGPIYTVHLMDFSHEYTPFLGLSLGISRPNRRQNEIIPIRLYGALLDRYQDTLPDLAYSGLMLHVEGFPYSEKDRVDPGRSDRRTWSFSWYVIATDLSFMVEVDA